jgi:hypothetical protein
MIDIKAVQLLRGGEDKVSEKSPFRTVGIDEISSPADLQITVPNYIATGCLAVEIRILGDRICPT